jgi:lauroyl/myristoyl acyltransferase
MLLFRSAEIGRMVISKFPACISYGIANMVGDLLYYTWPRVRRNVVRSVANVLNRDTNDREVRNIARHSLRNFSKYIVDILRYSYPRADFLEKHVKLKGREYLDAALSEGKGVILVSFHVGNLDLGIRLLSKLGYAVNAIVESLGSGQLDKFLQNPREKGGVKLVNAKEVSSRLLTVLKQNEILAMMIDCPNCTKGAKVKLGQKWVMMPTGAATLALRTGARLIPCGLFRTSNSTFLGIFGKPIEYHPTGVVADDLREITQSTVQVLEDMAKLSLDQWYVFHSLIKDELQTVGEPSRGN